MRISRHGRFAYTTRQVGITRCHSSNFSLNSLRMIVWQRRLLLKAACDPQATQSERSQAGELARSRAPDILYHASELGIREYIRHAAISPLKALNPKHVARATFASAGLLARLRGTERR